jgi:hypothetical protein
MQQELGDIVVFLATMALGLPISVITGLAVARPLVANGYDPVSVAFLTAATIAPLVMVMAFVLVRYAGFFNPSHARLF